MMATSLEEVAISNVKNLISIGRKIFLEIGISNNTGEYEDEYPIIWYPQGYFVFAQCTITSGLNNGITISAHSTNPPAQPKNYKALEENYI